MINNKDNIYNKNQIKCIVNADWPQELRCVTSFRNKMHKNYNTNAFYYINICYYGDMH